MNSNSSIGVFDSGLGGISVLATIHKLLPNEDLIFFGDSKYNPYGTKTKAEITERCIKICDWFVSQDVKAIVVACNTATSACVDVLRQRYRIDIIGMEPALKVACEREQCSKIAVWATDLTLKEKKFANLMERFDQDHTIYRVPCPKLVEIVEQDQLDDVNGTQRTIDDYILQSRHANCIVLGCTHFVFYRDILKKTLKNVTLVDGNEGTARHLKDILEQKKILNGSGGLISWYNTVPEKIKLSESLLERMEETVWE